MTGSRTRLVVAGAVLSLAVAALAGTSAPDSFATAPAPTLPLGDADLVETRTRQTLAPGVRLIRIVRGTEPSPEQEIQTTTRGPWRVNVLRIDPDVASGRLKASYGPDMARTEKTTRLVTLTGALAGVNASFFSLGAKYPGDPVGLGLYGGELLSEPAPAPAEVDFVVNAATGEVSIGRLGWSGAMRNRRTGARLALEHLNHPPVVPAGCVDKVDQTRCSDDGDLVRFDADFASSTPSGYGVEVVLGRDGCVVRRTRDRGTSLSAAQTSLQATGNDATTLLRRTRRGCLSARLRLTDENGQRLALGRALFGVNGRYRLTSGGEVSAPSGVGDFHARNPRTIAGTTAAGVIVLATIDGRQPSSVGTTIAETAAVADALGMADSVNLDGGGSTTMSVHGAPVNRPSDTFGERSVGDALVYVEGPVG